MSGGNGKNEKPSQSDGSARNSRGQFSAGNQLSRGNHHSTMARRFKGMIYDAVTDEDWHALVAKVKELALDDGERWATELLWSYLCGKPAQSVEMTGDVTFTLTEFYGALGRHAIAG